MSTITIELDNLTKEEQETVRRLAEKRKKPYFVPDFGEPFYYITSCSGVGFVANNSYQTYEGYLGVGNCFRTEEEAKEAITKLQMQTKWKRLSLEAGEADNPWDGKHDHWEVTYYVKEGIDYDEMTTCQDGAVHFPSEESLKAAIDELGEDNVKKYILGVEE